jgi:hypothetical protein
MFTRARNGIASSYDILMQREAVIKASRQGSDGEVGQSRQATTMRAALNQVMHLVPAFYAVDDWSHENAGESS